MSTPTGEWSPTTDQPADSGLLIGSLILSAIGLVIGLLITAAVGLLNLGLGIGLDYNATNLGAVLWPIVLYGINWLDEEVNGEAELLELALIIVISMLAGHLWNFLFGSSGWLAGLILAVAVSVTYFLYDDSKKLGLKKDVGLLMVTFLIQVGFLVLAVIVNVTLVNVVIWVLAQLRVLTVPETFPARTLIIWIFINGYFGLQEVLPKLSEASKPHLDIRPDDIPMMP